MKKYWCLLPVIVLGLLIIYLLYFTGCGGIVEIFLSLFCALIGIGYILIFYFIEIVDAFKTRKLKLDPSPIVSLLIVVSIGFFVQEIKTRQEGVVQLSAYKDFEYTTRMDLHFMDNLEIEVIYGHIEEKCSYYGNCYLNGDTLTITDLHLKGNVELPRKFLIAENYLIPLI